MKKMICIVMALCAVMLNSVAGGVLADVAGVAPWMGAVALNGVAMVSPLFMPEGVARAGLYSEIWTGETIKAFRNSAASIAWLSRIRSYDGAVANNNTINFVDLGGDPTVLVDNTTYPIGFEQLTDTPIAIGLHKYQTKATPLTDDEARGLSYDKMATIIERHREVVDEKKIAMALHALAPAENKAKTPVLLTTGASYEGRLRLTVQDIINLKEKFDKQKMPVQGRVLVLCPEHVNDLLVQDVNFANRYNNVTTGAIANMYGFDIYEYVDCPLFTVSTKKKVAYGTAAATGMQTASVAFYAPLMMKATGETKAYVDEPETQMQQWAYNVRHYFICLPFKEAGMASLVSGIAS